jgi:hypothetical protein
MSIPWRVVGPLVAVLLATGAALVVTRDDPPTAALTTAATTTEPPPVAITSNAPRYGSLEELAGAADLVVRGHVTRAERGRLFGDPGTESAIESRLVTLAVDEVLRGDDPGPGLLVEEEGWTEDGAPLVVDGAGPSVTGDDAIWFLTPVEGPEGPAFITVSAAGRYLVDGDDLRGPTGEDPLVAELAALTPSELAARIAALDP